MNQLIKTILFFLLTSGLMFAVLSGIDAGILPEPLVLIGLFGPAMMAIAFTKFEGEQSVKSLLAGYIKVKAPVSAYLITFMVIPLAMLLAFGLSFATGQVNPERWFAMLGIPQLIFIPLISIGEELGWRGYLQPMLRKKYSLIISSAIVGVTWGLWHLPGYYFGTGVVEGVSMFWFLVWVLGAALIMGYLYEVSESVFIPVLFHTISNMSFNVILMMPMHTGSAVPFILLAISALIIGGALCLWHSGLKTVESEGVGHYKYG